MKIVINDKKMVVLTAENARENRVLFNLVNVERGEPAVREKRGSYKKHCEVCGRVFKNRLGLGVHKTVTHGMPSMSPSAVYLRKKKATHIGNMNGTPVFVANNTQHASHTN